MVLILLAQPYTTYTHTVLKQWLSSCAKTCYCKKNRSYERGNHPAKFLLVVDYTTNKGWLLSPNPIMLFPQLHIFALDFLFSFIRSAIPQRTAF